MSGLYRVVGWLSALTFLGIFVGGMLNSLAFTGAPPGIHTGYNGALDVLLLPQSDPDETVEQLELALQIVVNEHHIQHTNLGVALEGRGRLDEAIDNYRRALMIREDHAGAHGNLGAALVATGDLEEGWRHLEEALSLTPEDPDVLVNLARVEGKRGDHARAEALYRQAIKFAPAHGTAHYNLARTLHVQGRAAEAEGLYRRAFELNPEVEVRSRRYLAQIMISQRNWREAAGHLLAAMERSPEEPGLALEAAKALMTLGDVGRAGPLLETTLRAEPDHPEALTLLARLLATHPQEDKRDGQRAVALAERARELTRGEHPAVLDALAAAYAAQGRHDEAVSVARDAAKQARARGDEGLARLIEGRIPRYAPSERPLEPAGE